jgi:hypothetical protein
MAMAVIQIMLVRHMFHDTWRISGIVREIIWQLVSADVFPHHAMHDRADGCSSPRAMGV